MKFEIKQSVYFIETNIAINKAYEIFPLNTRT